MHFLPAWRRHRDSLLRLRSLQGVASDNHRTVGLFSSIAGPTPRFIVSADSAGNAARAAPLEKGTFAHHAGAEHRTIVFKILRVFIFRSFGRCLE